MQESTVSNKMAGMANPFFEHPILNSPYECPARHWVGLPPFFCQVDAGFEVLIACAFNYEAHTTEFNKLGRIPVLKARLNADLHMADDLKNTGKGNLFVIFGEPDITILTDPDGQLRVKVNGVDVFHPNTGEVRSDGAEGIACWFLDTDYNEESFFVRHAYFLGANDPYSQRAKNHTQGRNQRRSLVQPEQRHVPSVRETKVRSHRSQSDQPSW